MDENQPDSIDESAIGDVEDPARLRQGLRIIRRRRWYLWSVLIVYLPTMWTTQRITHSFEKALPAFFIWFLVLLAVTAISAVAKCPRCGRYFHVNGMTLLYLRRCLHCQLHVNADKQANDVDAEDHSPLT